MNRSKAFLSSVLLLAATSTPAFSQEYLNGYVCSLQVHKLTSEINWLTDLEQAKALAKEQGKLVLWVHLVGKIDGAT